MHAKVLALGRVVNHLKMGRGAYFCIIALFFTAALGCFQRQASGSEWIFSLNEYGNSLWAKHPVWSTVTILMHFCK